MLHSPRKLPRRFNRSVTGETRRFVRRRHAARRQYSWEQMQRLLHRLQRKFASTRSTIVKLLIGAGVAVVVAAVGFALFSPALHLREIRVQRTDLRVDIEKVQQALLPLFGRHLLFLTGQEVEPLILKNMPDVVDATTEKQYPGTLIVHLELEPLIARLQIGEPDASAAAAGTGAEVGTDYLTERGMYVLYLPAQVEAHADLPLITMIDWGVRPRPWGPLLPTDFLDRMREAEQALLEQFGQPVVKRVVFLRAREFHLFTTEFALWFDIKSPVEEQLRRYRVFLQAVGKDQAKDYVDLRLTSRVVYR